MTLSNEQCIAVAEDIWGWELVVKYLPHKYWRETPMSAVDRRELMLIADSLYGVMLTVESMTKRGTPLNDWLNIIKGYPRDGDFVKVHLAALEAVRKEKEDAEGS